MRSVPTLFVLASLLALSLPASASTEPDCIPCGPVDSLCRKYLGTSCLAEAEEPALAASSAELVQPCMGVVCKTINQVCIRVLGAPCLG